MGDAVCFGAGVGRVFGAAEKTSGPMRNRAVGRGRLDAVPGVPPAAVPPLDSSVVCDVNTADLPGSTVSSFSSLLEKSQSAFTLARKRSGPKRPQRIDLGQQLRFNLAAVVGFASAFCSPSPGAADSVPRSESMMATDSGDNPSTTRSPDWRSRRRSIARQLSGAFREEGPTVALDGWQERREKNGVFSEKVM